MSVQVVRLGDWCAQDRQSVRPGQEPDLRYIGLETVEAHTGRLLDGALSKTPEEPQANSFSFGPEHVLYGKLRPYLNKVVLPDFRGKCSTELVPLRPADGLDRRYLAYFLRTPRTVEYISERTAGARMPRADMDFVLGLQIPLPALAEQLRIVDLLSRAEGIVHLRRHAQQKAAELIPALFVDMFGEPATNPRGLAVATLGEVLASADYGSSSKASDADVGLPMIRMGNVDYSGNVDLTDLKFVNLPPADADRFGLKDGDILFNRTNSKELVGKTGLWIGDRQAILASYFIRLRVSEQMARPFFVWAFMNTPHMKRVLFETARGAIGQANINSRELRAFRIPHPALDEQARFECRCRDVLALRSQQRHAMVKAEAAFQALLARAFSAASQPAFDREEATT